MKALLVVMMMSGTAAAETKLGVMADAGVPDGATASLVFRPVSALRLHGGVAYNTVSTGARVGVTVAPMKSWFTPTVSIDYGRYPEGELAAFDRQMTVGYDFANGHIGFALGRKRASFFLQAGMSRVSGAVHDESTDAKLVVWTPSARLGFVLYVY
jgi:hypothetical protein